MQAPLRRTALSRREARGALFVVLAVITILATLPGGESRPTLIGWDKVDHIASFAALAVLARSGWPDQRRWVAGLALFIYGVALEFLQGADFVGRTTSVSDIAANVVGIALGLALAFWLGRLARTLSWLPLRR